MDNFEIVKKLIGSIKPEGKSEVDEERLKNLAATCELIDKLLIEVNEVAKDYSSRQEYSMAQIGKFAKKYIEDTVIFLKE